MMATPMAPIQQAQPPLHIPVMRDEVVDGLAPQAGGVYVDGTFGLGGYSDAILAAADCRVIGIDRDPDAIRRAQPMIDRHRGRLTVLQGCFGEMEHLVRATGIDSVAGVTLDLGVSSPQLDEAERGFSFRFDGPLDMRMSQSGPSAADVVNTADEETLADIFYTLGEERHSRRVARTICLARQEQPITRTLQLADLVRRAVPRSRDGIDPATRSFQGLRLYVNDELGELGRGLAGAERLLAPGGRLAVVSFHSLEDRRVKAFLKTRSGGDGGGSRHLPMAAPQRQPSFRLVSRKAILPGEAECARNPRARSAKLRVAERTDAPAFPTPAFPTPAISEGDR